MATWGPIQLRLKGSRQVEFDGEASPAPGGGSGPIQSFRIPFAFDTPGIVSAGIDTGYTSEVGDLLLLVAVSVTTTWDGTNPTIYLSKNADPCNSGDYIISYGLTVPDAALSAGFNAVAGPPSNIGQPIATDTLPLRARIANSSDCSDPGSMQGEGEIILAVLKGQA